MGVIVYLSTYPSRSRFIHLDLDLYTSRYLYKKSHPKYPGGPRRGGREKTILGAHPLRDRYRVIYIYRKSQEFARN